MNLEHHRGLAKPHQLDDIICVSASLAPQAGKSLDDEQPPLAAEFAQDCLVTPDERSPFSLAV